MGGGTAPIAMIMDAAPEPDRLPDTPHPRAANQVFGHAASIQTLLAAINTGQVHHAWMITGPQGIGKATLAYQAAMTLLDHPVGDAGLFGAPDGVTQIGLPTDHPIATRMRAGSEPGMCILRRPLDEKTQRLKQAITVDEVRKLRSFFSLSAGGNGRRIVIVDAVDDLNVQAANALLKMLEEPPEGAVMFLITHQPGAVLPTIRSRCRVLALDPLPPDVVQQAFSTARAGDVFDPGLLPLAMGSVGRAVTLAANGGLALYSDLVALFSTAPTVDRAALFALIDQVTARGNDGGLARLADMLDIFLSRLARASVAPVGDSQACPGERDLFIRLNPSVHTARIWAQQHHQLGQALRDGTAVNLDPGALILDTALNIET
ncbi:MAG: DNA polymerase III subunit delta', partial [Pseudomonadota bacterium]